MSTFFKNPIVHGVLVGAVFLLGVFLNSDSALLQVTIGAVGAAVLAYLTQILG